MNERSLPLGARLRGAGAAWRVGPFVVHLRTRMPRLIAALERLYDLYPIVDEQVFRDFHLSIQPPRGPRAWLKFKPQALLRLDGYAPFHPLPAPQVFAVFEGGLNWAIAEHANQFLILHAAAIEHGGRVAIMPGIPGAGKSTLTAGLVAGDWRLLSDELALLSLDGLTVTPLARPISLKNDSIDLIRDRFPGAVFSDPIHETMKGTIAFLKAPADSVRRVAETARPAWVIFPAYAGGADAQLEPMPKAAAFMQLVENSYNYALHGAQGFSCLANLVDSCDCYRFTYGRLDDAADVFAGLRPPG